jgi:hypothetical protein
LTDLWALTSYFNPMRYRRRYANYRAFRDRLNVPLVAVELAHSPDFELTEEDADVLIQLRDGDVMWQKERLLNVALASVPDTCRKVVWVDCDIVFETEDWAERVDALLERFVLVQAFSHAHHLDTDGEAIATQPSAAHALASGTNEFGRPTLRGAGSTNNGLAWAARRELLEDAGFYDACVVGGGDLAMVAAAHGRFDVATRNMSDRQVGHYLEWARPYHEMTGAETGFADGLVSHLWHGDVESRRYRDRHDGLKRFGFDPADDIAHTADGAWRWNTDKPDLHAHVRSYFASRNEDGDTG